MHAAHAHVYAFAVCPVCLQVRDTWAVAGRLGDVPGSYIGAALVPAIIITVLFYFDHNVSSQMAQQPEVGQYTPLHHHYVSSSSSCVAKAAHTPHDPAPSCSSASARTDPAALHSHIKRVCPYTTQPSGITKPPTALIALICYCSSTWSRGQPTTGTFSCCLPW